MQGAPAFPDAVRDRPARCLVSSSTETPIAQGSNCCAPSAGAERLSLSGRELTIDYAEGVGSSKLTAKLIERALGTLGTGRNWTTVGKVLARAKLTDFPPTRAPS